MGGALFRVIAWGKTPQEAFNSARADAIREYGDGGYTGTIAEKCDFVVIEAPEGDIPKFLNAIEAVNMGEKHILDQLMDKKYHDVVLRAERIFDDKWGAALCIPSGKDDERGKQYFFTGWASD